METVTKYIGVQRLAVECELQIVVVRHWFSALASLTEGPVLGRLTAHTHCHVVVQTVHPANTQMRQIKRARSERVKG